jgi:UDP-N-acetylmuramoyl-tripeptide--D-alanyl-D-alanine ligase
LLSMPKDTDFAIIEMGANHVKEIEALCRIAQPDHGMITNIGQAHLEGFGGLAGVIRGKSELYSHLRESRGTVFLNKDMEHLQSAIGDGSYIPYGQKSESFELRSIASGTNVHFSANIDNDKYEVQTQLTGQYNMANFASAIAVGLHFGVPSKDICAAIADYTPDNQRSQITKTSRNTLILDAYNANPTSMKEALKNLYAVNKEDGFFILGDMFEMGVRSAELHQEIVDLASQLGLSGIVVGKAFAESRTNFLAYESKEGLTDYLKKNSLQGKTVLIKGSRGMKLEEIVDLL